MHKEKLGQVLSGSFCGIIDLEGNYDNIKYAKPNRFYDYCYANIPMIVSNNVEFLGKEINGTKGYTFESKCIDDAVKSIYNVYGYPEKLKRCHENVRDGETVNDMNLLDAITGKNILVVTHKDVTKTYRLERLQNLLKNNGRNVNVVFLQNDELQFK